MKRTLIGTGLIGTGIGLAALERGDLLTVYNRTASKTQTLVEAGANATDTAAKAVTQADVVHLALTADHAVDATLDAIAEHLRPEAIVIDHSTTSAAGAASRAERCAEAGIHFLHAPVFMSPTACRTSSGVIVVSGPEGVYHRASDLLARMTGRVWYVGDTPGAAATLKLCGNAMILAMIGGLSDAHSIATDNGLATEQVSELFRIFHPAMSLAGRGERMAQGDFTTLWSLIMARKDLGLMLDATRRPLAVLPGLAERMDALIEQGAGEEDLAVIGRDAQ